MSVFEACLTLTLHRNAIDEFRAFMSFEEFQYPAVTPERIVESTHGDEVVKACAIVQSVFYDRHLAVYNADTSPHNIDALLAEVHPWRVYEVCEGCEIAFCIYVNEKLSVQRQTVNKTLEVDGVVMSGNDKGKLWHNFYFSFCKDSYFIANVPKYLVILQAVII